MNSHKLFLLLLFIANTVYTEEIYKVEVIVIKFNDVVTDEKFTKNLEFTPENVEVLKENEIILMPEKFINNALSSSDLLDLDINKIEVKTQNKDEGIVNRSYDFYEYEELDSLNFLIGRLRWRENIEILDTLSWYQPIKNKNEYTHHFDEKNNVSLYLNLYQSRYLHLNLKAFDGKLYLEDEIKIFIDEDRRIKRSEISYFDHPRMGIIVRINKT
tara:strand:+ start:899 stop:1543 length:645 start_codon:yes stop_codon:yes gene_type:complete